MSRKRNELTAEQEQHLLGLMSRGGTVESNTKALKARGVKVSTSTVQRRMRELAGKGAKRKKPGVRAEPLPPPPPIPDVPAPPPLPDSLDDIPEGTTPETLDWWIQVAEQKARTADLDGIGKMGRLVIGMRDLKRKLAPPPKIDPNENPDMRAAAARGRELFHTLIDKAVGRD